MVTATLKGQKDKSYLLRWVPLVVVGQRACAMGSCLRLISRTGARSEAGPCYTHDEDRRLGEAVRKLLVKAE